MERKALTMRFSWLDNAKMVAMLCVIAGHMGALFGGWPLDIGGLIVAFNMPLFVLLSGYTSLGCFLRLDEIKDLLDFAEKTLWRMLVPAVCLSAVDQAWRGLFFSRKLWMVYAALVVVLWLAGIWKERNSSQVLSLCLDIVRAMLVFFLLCASINLNIYWFLSMLLKLQIAAAIIVHAVRYLKGFSGYVVPFASVLLWFLSYFVYDSWTFEMATYFSIGLVIKQIGIFDKVLQMKQWLTFTLFIVGSVLCYSFTISYSFYTNGLNELIGQGMFLIYPIRMVVALFISLAIIRWVYALSGEYNWFSKMGSYTLAFYTIHCLILDDFLKPYIHFNNPDNCMWIIGIMSALALTAVTYLIIRLCEQWIVTRRLVLGILK